MTEPIFDHDRLDIYRVTIDYVGFAFTVAKDLTGVHRPARESSIEYEYRGAEYEYEHDNPKRC